MPAVGQGRVIGIDYLRAFFSVCVVAVHLNYIFPSLIFDPVNYVAHTFTISDFINFYVLCLAVPVFVLIATYLYARKPTDFNGLLKRIGRLARLLVFWSILFQVYYLTGLGAVKSLPNNLRDLGIYVMNGGNTVYYFFLSLALVTIATHYAMRLSTRLVSGLFAASTLLVGVLPILHRETGIIFLAHHANPFNFLPYAFAGIGLARLAQAGSIRQLNMIGLGCLALAVPAALLDWTVYVDGCFFEVNQFAIPAYTRPSLVFLAVAVMVLAVQTRRMGNSLVAFMAFHSLAVYCLHPFFMDIKFKLIEVLGLTEPLRTFVPIVFVLGLSYVGSIVMPLFLRHEMIR
jgi:Acyltransferase family